MNNIYHFSGSIKSDIDCVKSFLKQTLDELKEYVNEEVILFEIRLILNELVINSILHGNLNDVEKKVHLDLNLYNNYITIAVKDEGEGIKVKIGQEDNDKCCGRGLILVEALTESLILNKNEVIVIKRI